jgi:hypothetical protein
MIPNTAEMATRISKICVVIDTHCWRDVGDGARLKIFFDLTTLQSQSPVYGQVPAVGLGIPDQHPGHIDRFDQCRAPFIHMFPQLELVSLLLHVLSPGTA